MINMLSITLRKYGKALEYYLSDLKNIYSQNNNLFIFGYTIGYLGYK